MAENSGPNPPPAPAAQAQHSWAKTTLWAAITLFLVVGMVLVFKSCVEMPVKVIGKAGQAMAEVAAAFKRGTITTSFVSYATSLSNNTYLQFATLKQMEIFTRTEEPSTAFGYIPLPDVIVEARAPVEYTYYLDLNAKWQLTLRDGVIEVLAPSIRFNKPAVDPSGIVYEVKKGYVKSAEAQENLKRSITGLVVLRAKDNIHLVRETGRKQTADFIEKWLSKSFADGKRFPVKVSFQDESAPENVAIPGQPSN